MFKNDIDDLEDALEMLTNLQTMIETQLKKKSVNMHPENGKKSTNKFTGIDRNHIVIEMN